MTNIYIEIDNCAPKKTVKKYGYILEYKGVTRTGFGQVEGTYHSATLDIINMALKRFNRPSKICIHSRNGFVLSEIMEDFPKWKEMDFLSSKGKPVANREKWQQFKELSKKHEITVKVGSHEYGSWLLTEIKRKGER